MSRPKPTIILSHTGRDWQTVEVLEADATYAITYQTRRIGVRHRSETMIDARGYCRTKYPKASFSNPGHAFNLADKLNRLFKTADFAVVRLTDGEIIREDCSKIKDDIDHSKRNVLTVVEGVKYSCEKNSSALDILRDRVTKGQPITMTPDGIREMSRRSKHPQTLRIMALEDDLAELQGRFEALMAVLKRLGIGPIR